MQYILALIVEFRMYGVTRYCRCLLVHPIIYRLGVPRLLTTAFTWQSSCITQSKSICLSYIIICILVRIHTKTSYLLIVLQNGMSVLL